MKERIKHNHADKILIEGGHELRGNISISGAKNSVLPLMIASLLTDSLLKIRNSPILTDVLVLSETLENLGVNISFSRKDSSSSEITLCSKSILKTEVFSETISRTRASILMLGPLVSRFGRAKIPLPGGCAIGSRPVDLHLMVLEKLGARIKLSRGYIVATSLRRLEGTSINFPRITVTGTENAMMAAVLARGTTVLYNSSYEPEIEDLANCLVSMGAKILGIGTSTLKIEGVDQLHGTNHKVIPDRIETGTYAMAVGMVGGSIELINTKVSFLPTVLETLNKVGLQIKETDKGINVTSDGYIRPIFIETKPFPGYPTDLQAPLVSLMCKACGISTIIENIFENRFMHIPELAKMGADISTKGSIIEIKGGRPLRGALVTATDLRASASLVLAGLAAKGSTIIDKAYHLDRGYSRMEEKLKTCGAYIERIKNKN